MDRRHLFKTVAACVPAAVFPFGEVLGASAPGKKLPVKTKISLNAYSFNNPLRSGEMTISDMLDFAAETGFEGVDLTGYYFPGYPTVPSDEYIYRIKRKAFRLGIEICGSGVKNDFTLTDPSALEAEKKLVKDWIVVASKLGAQTLRIFSGAGVSEGHTWKQIADRMTADILECARYAQQYGVVLALQNHNDFLGTADDVNTIMQMINSEWVGLMLDVGCYRSTDPYAEIAQTINHTVTWQVKEEVYVNNLPVKIDLDKLKKIIDASDFRGYLPIETLGPGDAKQKVTAMYREVKKRFG